MSFKETYMCASRGNEPTSSAHRAQSTILGLVLLIGMVAAGSFGIFLVAGDMLTDVEQESEHDRIESAFVELSQQMATASANDDVSRSMDIDVGDDGAVVMSDTGELRISGGDVQTNVSIGAIEYTGDDDTRIAYQAGGVFRETGNETQIASAPPIEYDADSETLSFPIIKTRDEAHLDSGEISVTHYDTDPLQNASLVENDSVTIEVESEYYRGWEEYFERQGGPTAVQDIEIHDDDRGTVTAEFGFADIESAFDSGITYSEEVDDFKDTFGDQARVGNLPEMDSVIDEMVHDAKNDSDEDLGEIDSSESLSDGFYYADEIDLQSNDDHVDFDLSEGNATLVVNGDITMSSPDAKLTADPAGEDHMLRVYSTGNFNFENGKIAPEPSSGDPKAEQLQVYGTSELDAQFTNGEFHGTFYAASYDWEGPNDLTNEEYQVDFHSNPEFKGGLVAHSANVHANASNFEYDDSLDDGDLSAYPDEYTLPPQLTYLNVAEHKVDVEPN